MDNSEIKDVGKKTRALMEKVKKELDISDDACLQFIMLCLAFDVESMDLSTLDEKTRKAIDIVTHDKEFKEMVKDISEHVRKNKGEQNA